MTEKTEIARAPLTFGQLSVWRSIADLPPDRLAGANLSRAWPLPAGCTVADVRHALDLLEERHESLRTGYVRQGGHDIEQVVWPARGVDSEVTELDGTPGSTAARLATDLAAQPFALDRDRQLRARVVVTGGRPTHLVVSIHHMAADGAGLDLLHDELLQLLCGVALDEPAPTCRALADEQRHDRAWQLRASAALTHWRRTIEQAGPATPLPDEAGAVHWSRLRSRPALDAARALAQATSTSVGSVVLAAYCRELARRTGRDRQLVGLIAGNRNDPTSRALVSSLNQLVPLLAEVPAGCPFDELVRSVHWAALMANRHGCFDVDGLAELQAAFGFDGVGAGFRHFFNFMPGTAPGSPGTDPPGDDGWRVETTTQGRDNGFPFYLKGGDGEQLDVSLRERGDDPTATEGFLVGLQDVLLAAAPTRGGR
jgi:hypothetical protein